MFISRRLTDQICLWVKIVVVVNLIFGEVNHAHSNLIIDLGCPGDFLLLLAFHWSGLRSPISHPFTVALYLSSWPSSVDDALATF